MKGIVLSKKMFLAYGVFVVMFSAQFAHAQSVELGQPTYGGTGCPAELAPSITISKGVLSVRYNNFKLEDTADGAIGRKNCSIRLPINVLGQYRLAIESIELRGVSRVPQAASLDFRADANFVGGERLEVAQKIMGPKGTQSVRLAKRSSALSHTKCGEDVMLAMSTNMTYVKNANVASGVRGQARVLQTKLILEPCQ